MKLAVVGVVVGVGCALVGEGRARADDPPVPGFVTLDRADASSHVGVESSFVELPQQSSGTLLRADVHGQYVDAASGLGGYATLPGSFASGNGSSDEQIGDAELGGIYARAPSADGVGVAAHLGITLPTGASGDNGLINAFALQSRLTDYFLVAPRGWSLRAGVSPIVRNGAFFARADLGFDLGLAADGGTANAAHVNVGVGYQAGPAALMAELVNLVILPSQGDSTTIDGAALSARFIADGFEPYAAIVIPIDQDARSALSFAVTLGVNVKLEH